MRVSERESIVERIDRGGRERERDTEREKRESENEHENRSWS